MAQEVVDEAEIDRLVEDEEEKTDKIITAGRLILKLYPLLLIQTS